MGNRTPPVHHLDDALLAPYAAGACSGARALIAAVHLTYCSACRAKVSAFEAVGGELLEQERGAELNSIADPDGFHHGSVFQGPEEADDFAYAPRPLRSLLQGEGRWVNVWFGVKELSIQGFSPAARLLWIPAGRRMPRHDHHGEELTLVLRGSFSDVTGRYSTGDLQVGKPGLDHQPHAGSDGPCICLVVEERGLKLSGWLGRLVTWRGGAR